MIFSFLRVCLESFNIIPHSEEFFKGVLEVLRCHQEAGPSFRIAPLLEIRIMYRSKGRQQYARLTESACGDPLFHVVQLSLQSIALGNQLLLLLVLLGLAGLTAATGKGNDQTKAQLQAGDEKSPPLTAVQGYEHHTQNEHDSTDNQEEPADTAARRRRRGRVDLLIQALDLLLQLDSLTVLGIYCPDFTGKSCASGGREPRAVAIQKGNEGLLEIRKNVFLIRENLLEARLDLGVNAAGCNHTVGALAAGGADCTVLIEKALGAGSKHARNTLRDLYRTRNQGATLPSVQRT